MRQLKLSSVNERVRQSVLAYLRMRGLADGNGVFPELYEIITGRGRK